MTFHFLSLGYFPRCFMFLCRMLLPPNKLSIRYSPFLLRLYHSLGVVLCVLSSCCNSSSIPILFLVPSHFLLYYKHLLFHGSIYYDLKIAFACGAFRIYVMLVINLQIFIYIHHIKVGVFLLLVFIEW